ncbi:MAG TPA: T9SS type A sorting domain-containing protein, partial [Bacteroidales bacterium]|nr:T9SS type A sorting domain-containing protein [Bacteroidales bacterium]
DITVYPNPATDHLNIQNPQASEIHIKLYSIDGRLMKSIKCTSVTARMQTGNLPAGHYLISIEKANQLPKRMQVIIQ